MKRQHKSIPSVTFDDVMPKVTRTPGQVMYEKTNQGYFQTIEVEERNGRFYMRAFEEHGNDDDTFSVLIEPCEGEPWVSKERMLEVFSGSPCTEIERLVLTQMLNRAFGKSKQRSLLMIDDIVITEPDHSIVTIQMAELRQKELELDQRLQAMRQEKLISEIDSIGGQL